MVCTMYFHNIYNTAGNTNQVNVSLTSNFVFFLQMNYAG